MDIRTSQITSILIILILPVVFGIFWLFKSRGEKKLNPQDTIRTRPSKLLSGFFLGFAVLVLVGGTALIIYTSIVDSEHTTVGIVIAATAAVVGFSLIGFFGYAWVRFNYVVADSEGVHAYRLFRKKKFYRYEEIGCFNDTTSLGIYGGIKCYDKNNKKIFEVEALQIGTTAVVQKMREHGVEEKGQWQLKSQK